MMLMRRHGVPENLATALSVATAAFRAFGSGGEVDRPLHDGAALEFAGRSLTVASSARPQPLRRDPARRATGDRDRRRSPAGADLLQPADLATARRAGRRRRRAPARAADLHRLAAGHTRAAAAARARRPWPTRDRPRRADRRAAAAARRAARARSPRCCAQGPGPRSSWQPRCGLRWRSHRRS